MGNIRWAWDRVQLNHGRNKSAKGFAQCCESAACAALLHDRLVQKLLFYDQKGWLDKYTHSDIETLLSVTSLCHVGMLQRLGLPGPRVALSLRGRLLLHRACVRHSSGSVQHVWDAGFAGLLGEL